MSTACVNHLDSSRSASPANRMLESDWSYATKELLQVTGKDIIEERQVCGSETY